MARRTPGTLLAAPLAALAALIGFAAAPAQAAVWSSSDQWGSYTTPDGYTLYNDIWGSGAGTQTIWANSSANWGVSADHPNTGGIKAYPNAKKVIGKAISSLASLTSTYNVTVPSSGAYNTSYDIWDDDYANEIMLWVNYNGAVGPLGSSVGTVTLGSDTWTVYVGSNGANNVYSFLRTSDSTAGSVNILSVLKWLKDTKGYIGNETIGDVQFGYEITSSPGGLNFTTNGFSVSSG
ncbi:GH12 family glycosyl hydrolase domain-containing protein [Streptomyces sp. NBC_00344]|uniref:GH12 family glycosyl hydrolase domain-containing protein n=1 Tax=Streptomyces sp. NBC_00344 TaxID=2975720 RepID=UPI002E238DE7